MKEENSELFPFTTVVCDGRISITLDSGFESWCLDNGSSRFLKGLCGDVFNIGGRYKNFPATGTLMSLVEEDISRWNRGHDQNKDGWYNLKQEYFRDMSRGGFHGVV